MLREKISNPWIKFKLTGANAKEAFLHVICSYDAKRFDKKKMLDTVVARCPGVLSRLTETDILKAFKQLRENISQQGESLSTEELRWAEEYFNGPDLIREMEKILYYSLLSADHLAETRWTFKWSLSENDMRGVAKDALGSPEISPGLKISIAKEFNEPADQFEIAYLYELLQGRRYDSVGIIFEKYPGAVISAIVYDIDAGYIHDAFEIARRFLPGRQDVTDEIQEIKNALK